jgi:hypothetical protein
MVEKDEQGVMTPNMEDGGSVNANSPDAIYSNGQNSLPVRLLERNDRWPLITRQVSFNEMMTLLSRICSICQTSFFIGGFVCPCNICGTFFHKGCLIRWLVTSRECPFCSTQENSKSNCSVQNVGTC